MITQTEATAGDAAGSARCAGGGSAGFAAMGAGSTGTGLATVFSAQMGLAALAGAGANNLGLGKPFGHPIMLLDHLHVAGTTHVVGIEELVEHLEPGVRLTLRRDPENAHDKNAIKVLLPGSTGGEARRLGYLPCDSNQVIARLMDGGKNCYAQVVSIQVRGTWCKIDIEVYLDD